MELPVELLERIEPLVEPIERMEPLEPMEPFRLRKILLNLSPPDRLEQHDDLTEEDYEVFETTAR